MPQVTLNTRIDIKTDKLLRDFILIKGGSMAGLVDKAIQDYIKKETRANKKENK